MDYTTEHVGIARAENLKLIFQTCTFIFIFRQFSFMQLQYGLKGNVCSLVKIKVNCFKTRLLQQV